jgi:hypothetical protein
MILSYGQLEAVLVGHLRIHPDKISTLRSRIKQLQRLKFPPGVNVGRGTKMEYSGEHLFMLVTVFELMGFGFPAQYACNLTLKHWKEFSAGYALAALQRRNFSWDEDKNNVDQVLAVLSVQSLHDIQFHKHSEPKPSSVHLYDLDAVKGSLRPFEFYEVFTRLFISLGLLTTRILEIASSRAGVREASIYSHDFHSWLPKERVNYVSFAKPYPDRSNIPMRQDLNGIYGNDPDASTPDGLEEAKEFLSNDYNFEAPF